MTINTFRELALKASSRYIRFSLAILVVALCSFAIRAGDIQNVDGDTVDSIAKRATKQIKRGALNDAEKLLNQALAISPQNVNARLALAYLDIKRRHWAEAYNISLDVAKSDPNNARAFAILGVSLLNAGRFDDAKKILYNAIALNKKEALAWAGCGMLDFYENRVADSLANLRTAVYQDSTDADFIFALAQVAARDEKYTEAADAYRQFLMIADRTDSERRDRIKGLIDFLRFLGQRDSLYITAGNDSTSVPIELTSNRPVIKLNVNGSSRPLNFVLDTGSGISVISDQTAKLLKIKPIARGGYAKGIGGDGKFEIVYGFLKDVGIGTVSIKNVPVYIRQFHTTNENIDGYIGLSLISKFLATLDYGDLKFDLRKKDDTFSDVTKASVSLPLRLTSSGFLSGEVLLEGVDSPLNFIVDTGASVSVISDAIAGTDGMSRFSRVEKLRVIGSAGVTEGVRTFLLPKVSFGTHTRNSITAIALDLDMINEASGFQQSGILGGNFLKNYKLTFDFKNSKVTFDPIVREQ